MKYFSLGSDKEVKIDRIKIVSQQCDIQREEQRVM
jgi:hypothetical protein